MLSLRTKWEGKKALSSIVAITLLVSVNAYAGLSFEDSYNRSTIDGKMEMALKEAIEKKKKETFLNYKPKKKSDLPTYYGKSLYELLNLKKEDKGYIEDNNLIKLSVTIPFKRVKRVIKNSSLYIEVDKGGERYCL